MLTGATGLLDLNLAPCHSSTRRDSREKKLKGHQIDGGGGEEGEPTFLKFVPGC